MAQVPVEDLVRQVHEGKSVDFLQRLAEVVSATLQAASSPGV